MLTLTDAAVAKAAQYVDQAPDPESFLRVAVQPGGCAGLRYQLRLDTEELDGDYTSEYETPSFTLRVVVDRYSHPYLEGATLDYVDRLDAQGFLFDNPNASGGCSCGDSFC